eukprot:gene17786-19565_t
MRITMPGRGGISKSLSLNRITAITNDEPGSTVDTGDSTRKFRGLFKSKTVYGKQGKSFGNKLLISLPILNVLIPLVFIIASYIYAEQTHKSFLPHGNTVPFISDIGDKRPQSSLFTFGLTLGSFATLGVIITRYCQVKHFSLQFDNKANKCALFVGLLFLLGKLVVVSFQLSSEKAVHFIGAGIYVIFATVYSIIQTAISCKNRRLYGAYEKYILATRILLLAAMIIGTFLFGVFLAPSLTKYNRKGYSVSQSGEWLFACGKMFYLLTFVVDFWPMHPKLLLIKPRKRRPTEAGATVLSNARVLRISYEHCLENGEPPTNDEPGVSTADHGPPS